MRVLQPQYISRLESVVLPALKWLFPFHAAAWHVASMSIEDMVNASTMHEQAQRMDKWRVATLSQLTNVMLIVSNTVDTFWINWPCHDA